MKRLFKNIPENLEVLFMLVLGILLQMTDGSPFTIRERWMIVWETELPAQHFSLLVQKCIKTVLSVIVVVRCVTTYAYVVSAMLVIFSIVKDSAPKLMLLWLLISGLKSVCMTFVEALIGVYVCSAFGKIRKACLEFFVSKALEIIFASYLWGCVLNMYHDMERRGAESEKLSKWDQVYFQKTDLRHHRPRSLIDQSTLYKTACLNNFEFRHVPLILLQMMKSEEKMSQDSLLAPGMMLASVSDMGSFDNLKTSLSLGELGLIDLKSVQVVGLEDDDNMTPPEKALKFLKLTWSDVRKAKVNKTVLSSETLGVDNALWNRLTTSKAHIKAPEKPRTGIFIKDIPQVESDERGELLKRKPQKRSFELKFDISLFKYFQGDNNSEKECDSSERRSTILSFEEEDKEWEGEDLFMSNIKEEIAVNRIRIEFVSKAMKADAYANLYTQEFMSTIGPEVFDRASKLPKVTSLSKIFYREKVLVLASNSTEKERKKKVILEDAWVEKSEASESELYNRDLMEEKGEQEQNSLNVINSKTEGETSVSEISLTNPEKEHEIVESHESPNLIIAENISEISIEKPDEPHAESTSLLNLHSDVECKESGLSLIGRPRFKKRKIIIKRTRKRVRNQKIIEYYNASYKNFANDSDDSCVSLSRSESENDNIKEGQNLDTEERDSTSTSRAEEIWKERKRNTESKQIYFLTELLQKPLPDVLIMYYDLKRAEQFRENVSRIIIQNLMQKCRNLPGTEKFEKKPKWKSKVLERAAADSSTGSKIDVMRNEECSGKLIDGLEAVLDGKGVMVTKDKDRINFSSLLYKDDVWGKYKMPFTLFDKTSLSEVKNEPLESLTVHKNSKNAYFYKLDKGVSEDVEEQKHTSLERIKKLKCGSSLSINKSDKEPNIEKDSFESTKINQDIYSIEELEEFDISSDADTYLTLPELSGTQNSDESFSLYYSKTADLASPLLDMKRFIYPDHIHYSYKHVKKKGFDVDITNGLPLLVRESLTMNPPSSIKKVMKATNPELKITRRPMDLSFARTNAFAEWDPNDTNLKPEKKSSLSSKDINHGKKSSCKPKKWGKKLRTRKHNEKFELLKNKELQTSITKNVAYFYSVKDYLLIAKLLRTLQQQNCKTGYGKDRTPIQISSTQLHSNKGRVKSTYNPAISLQENKTRSEKRKVETQEERTKDMFARLEREALWQSKNVNR